MIGLAFVGNEVVGTVSVEETARGVDSVGAFEPVEFSCSLTLKVISSVVVSGIEVEDAKAGSLLVISELLEFEKSKSESEWR